MRITFAAVALAVVIAGDAGPAWGVPPIAARESYFRFQDNFWVNLHHFVRAEARRRTMGAAPVLALTSLSEQERAAWTAALDAYTELANKSLIFDAGLIAINNELAVLTDDRKLPPGLVDPAVTAALNRAALVFRAHLWPEVRRTNDAWIAQFSALAEQHAAKLFPALAATYHATWPRGPVLVDTSIETGPTLAYTTGGPPGTAGHTTIAPTKTQDLYVAIETLFHEASHCVDDQIISAVEAEGARQHVKPLPDLWHGIIFFTAGELVRRELGKGSDVTYQPYAVRFGIWERGWQQIHSALEKEWRPYLEGKVSYETALANLVAASTALPEKPERPVSEYSRLPACSLGLLARQAGSLSYNGARSMADNKTKPTNLSVAAFIDTIPDDTKRADAKALVKLMQKATGEKPKMWGPSIIGFGTYHYAYDSGREGDMPIVGFSPRKAATVLYIQAGAGASQPLLAKLGKHTTGKGCLYIKKLADVDQKVLEELINKGIAARRAR